MKIKGFFFLGLLAVGTAACGGNSASSTNPNTSGSEYSSTDEKRAYVIGAGMAMPEMKAGGAKRAFFTSVTSNITANVNGGGALIVKANANFNNVEWLPTINDVSVPNQQAILDYITANQGTVPADITKVAAAAATAPYVANIHADIVLNGIPSTIVNGQAVVKRLSLWAISPGLIGNGTSYRPTVGLTMIPVISQEFDTITSNLVLSTSADPATDATAAKSALQNVAAKRIAKIDVPMNKIVKRKFIMNLTGDFSTALAQSYSGGIFFVLIAETGTAEMTTLTVNGGGSGTDLLQILFNSIGTPDNQYNAFKTYLETGYGATITSGNITNVTFP